MRARSLLTFVLLAAVTLSSCKTRQYSRNNRKIEKEANRSNPNYQSYTTLSYIDQFKAVAIEEMNSSGIPASITLAQGIIESGSGNSDLAKYANNHFGIKCTLEWKGKTYYRDDDQKNDCFRVYKDARESFRDHSEFLKRKRYSALFQLDKNDYRNWAKGLKEAGYATNPRYPELLINIIEKYSLFQYDSPESEKEKIRREDRVFAEINQNIPQEKKKFTPVADPPAAGPVVKAPDTLRISAPSGSVPPAGTVPEKYVVQKGDTLYSISRKFNISVDQLKLLNNLPDNNIRLGQELKVK